MTMATTLSRKYIRNKANSRLRKNLWKKSKQCLSLPWQLMQLSTMLLQILSWFSIKQTTIGKNSSILPQGLWAILFRTKESISPQESTSTSWKLMNSYSLNLEWELNILRKWVKKLLIKFGSKIWKGAQNVSALNSIQN